MTSTMHELRIILLQVGELEKLIASDDYQRMPVIPISPQRAVSQGRNPRAQPEDPALALAYSGEELVGYLGAVPDHFFPDGTTPVRMAWLSCLWVSPSQRGKGVAKKLLHTLLDAWENRVILTEFTPEVKNLYDRTEALSESDAVEGFRGYLRPNLAQILPPKNTFWQKIRPLLHLADALLSAPNALRIYLLHTADLPCRIRYLNEIDASARAFIASRLEGELARRDGAVLSWILQYPWVTEAPFADETARRYHFTAISRQFMQQPVALLDDTGQMMAVLLLSLRNGHMRVPHAWFADDHTAVVAQCIFAHAIACGASMLTLYHPRLAAYAWQNRHPFYAAKKVRRSYFVGKGLHEILDQQPLHLQDGDGDAAFT
jgi:GNAT superfamily N-acetyltransferase